jgi:predicted heme/steroid binding protein
MQGLEVLKEYTRGQLALRNGQDRVEIWCAFQGKIYDLSESRLWIIGKHYEHWAGQDLTRELPEAPHNDSVFRKFKIVGKLKE